MKNLFEWPSCISGYLLNRINEDELLKISKNDDLADRKLCKCYFYIYCKNKELNNEYGIKYLKKIMELLDPTIMLEPEYYLAKYEIGQIE